MNPTQNPNSQAMPQSPAPPQGQDSSQPQQQLVQVVRPVNPMPVEIPPEIQQKAEESRRRYPNLNLSPGEFVIDSVQRHPVGILKIWVVIFGLIASILLLALFFTSLVGAEGALVTGFTANLVLFSGIVLLSVIFALGGIIATYVYNNNHFYLTNESVIQEITESLFSRRVQTVSLINIEDASYHQEGILPHLLNYGDIRLSTEGDETTYRFSYVAEPDKHIAKLNNAVEAFKNGRPVIND